MARELALLIALAACKGGDKPRSAAPAPSGGSALAATNIYRLEQGPQTPCAANTPCEARIVLTALGDFHVNKDYPFKFVADPPSPGVEGTGAFALDDERNGTLTIRFTPTARGTATLTGTFKLSVCTSEVCEIEAPKIELSIPVT